MNKFFSLLFSSYLLFLCPFAYAETSSGYLSQSKGVDISSQILYDLPQIFSKDLDSVFVSGRFNEPRAFAGGGSVYMFAGSIKSEDEFKQILVHELAHVVDDYTWRGHGAGSGFMDGKLELKEGDKSLDFYRISWQSTDKKKPETERKDFVSGYASTAPFEDFAESISLYYFQGESFRELSKKSLQLKLKYKFIKENLFQGKEFDGGSGMVPIFDVTLLPISQ